MPWYVEAFADVIYRGLCLVFGSFFVDLLLRHTEKFLNRVGILLLRYLAPEFRRLYVYVDELRCNRNCAVWICPSVGFTNINNHAYANYEHMQEKICYWLLENLNTWQSTNRDQVSTMPNVELTKIHFWFVIIS